LERDHDSRRDHDQPALLHDSIKGRPLVILETGDAILNRALVATARHYGVPVNVPDQIDLCSFYLASIVDRAPLYSNPFSDHA
jgi:uroporphyrin-III C-methyltransferase/precorrin-2 dehydrogenase/sirohydrochlorin ferrochelatase